MNCSLVLDNPLAVCYNLYRRIDMRPKGFKHTESTKQKLHSTHLAEKNPMWKGDEVGYGALHAWVRRQLPKPPLCDICGKAKPIDLTNISGEYKRDFYDWQWLCRKCHMILDGRLIKFRNLCPFVKGHTKYIGRERDNYGRFI